MLNVWPVFVVGVQVGLILAAAAFALVQFGLRPLLEKSRSGRKRIGSAPAKDSASAWRVAP